MTRAEILAKVGRALNKASSLDATTKARLLDHIDRRHRQVLSAPGCAGLRRRQFRFASVAGQARYSVINGQDIKHIRDLTNDRELTQRSLNTYRQFNPDPVNSPGTPDGFIQYGFEPVELQPPDVGSAGTLLFAKSTSAADIAPLTVYINGGSQAFSAVLNGTTPVSIAGVTYIDKFFLSAVPVGNVSLHADSGTGPQLAIMGGVTSVTWLVFYLDQTPTSALLYEADVEYQIPDLAQDTDTPWLPSDFHDVLELGAVMDELHHLDDSRVVLFQRRYDKRLGELQLRLARQGTDAGPRGRTSRYGAWGPSTSW